MLDGVESRLFTTRDFALESGVVVPELTVAYETYGSLAPDGRNAVLAVHGYTSSHHAAGRDQGGGAPKGCAAPCCRLGDKLIGPGKANRHETDCRRLLTRWALAHGNDRAGQWESERREPYGPDFFRAMPSPTRCAREGNARPFRRQASDRDAGLDNGATRSFQRAVSHQASWTPGIVGAPSSAANTLR